ncbi:MAG: Shedu immune nuclease family protein [Pseudomonadota bacterium]
MKKPAIEFKAVGSKLHLIYRPHEGTQWVYRKFKTGDDITVKGTFCLTRRVLVDDDVDEWTEVDGWAPRTDPDDFDFDFGGEDRMDFVIAASVGDYFLFDAEVLPVGVSVMLHRQACPTWKWFCAERKTSILGIVAKLKMSRIVLGGPAPDAIPVVEFEKLIAQFPTTHELQRYVVARISGVVREYTDAEVDGVEQLRKTVARKVKGSPKDLAAPFREADMRKFEYLLAHLNRMLSKPNQYKESHWQSEIVKIVCLLNPKYIEAFTGVRVKDFDGGSYRILDIMLVDASGNVDVVEIKQPFGEAMVTPRRYRKNHVPMRELSGTVMQVEKYLLHLTRWGSKGEEALTKRYASRLPPGFKIHVVNPCGLVIMGRDADMTPDQRGDFEVTRRHYKHIADIVTYDDLLRRLEAVLNKLRAGI